jgi:molybdate transport repressor ModE-like protein
VLEIVRNAITFAPFHIRTCRTVESISTEGSFSAAAARTGYSQSAISGQIATLERVIGVRLVTRIRGSRKVTLTREGERLVEHARAINARLNAARADIEQLDGTGADGVRIGRLPSVSQTLLPDIVRGLTADGTPLTLREGMEVEHQVEMLRSGELDVAFVLLPIDDESVETMELLRDPWVLVVRTDHPLVWKQRPTTPTTSRTCRSSRSSSFGRRS